jgi:hypothetical protein
LPRLPMKAEKIEQIRFRVGIRPIDESVLDALLGVIRKFLPDCEIQVAYDLNRDIFVDSTKPWDERRRLHQD